MFPSVSALWVVLCLTTLARASPLTDELLDALGALVPGLPVLPFGYNLKDNDEFEYVVVGAGAAGCAVAARLTQAGHSVAVLEAGDAPSPLTWVPGAALALMGTKDDWQYDSIPNNVSCLSSKGKQCRASRGKALGGSTAINHMIYLRGNRADYNYDLPGWTWEDIKPYFLKFEGLRDLDKFPKSSIPFHNTTGPVSVGYCADPRVVWRQRLVEGFKSLGLPFNRDANGVSQVGVTRTVTYTKGGERMSAARAYLLLEDVKRALRVSTATHVTSVLFGDGNVANGVTAVGGPLREKITVRASRGVVLSAGAFSTPQLLMLSGIGPAKHLEEKGIKTRNDLPVGRNLSDHVLPIVLIKLKAPLLKKLQSAVNFGTSPLEYIASRKGYLASIDLHDTIVLANTLCYDYEAKRWDNSSPDCEIPSLELISTYVPQGSITIGSPLLQQSTQLNDDVISQVAAISAGSSMIIASPVVLSPASRGWVKLTSSDPLDRPAIFPNYLGESSDLEEMLRSITILENLMDTPAFRGASLVHLDLPGCPRYSSDRLGYWSCYARHMTFSVFHSAGSCALGDVLDARLGVRGARALHVADLSALPRVPRGNTAAAAIAVGERLADFLIHDRSV